MKLVTKASQISNNLSKLAAELKISPDLAARLGLAHAWYIDTRDPTQPKFGFSKFVGYENLDAETYLGNYKKLDGRNTEWVLKDFCEELGADTPEFERYHGMLADWLAKFGKKPRKKVRLMALQLESQEEAGSEDRRLLELMAVVADLLPLDQRHELRSRL